MKRKNKIFLTGTTLIGLAGGIFSPSTFAGDVTMPVNAVIKSSLSENVTRNLHFGEIDLAPGSSRVTLNASAAGATGQDALPTGTNDTIVTGGHSGLITVEAAMDMTISIDYPANGLVTLAPGNLEVKDIALNSQGGNGTTISHTGGTTTTIAVGGYIEFDGDEEDGTHSGTMTITLNYL